MFLLWCLFLACMHTNTAIPTYWFFSPFRTCEEWSVEADFCFPSFHLFPSFIAFPSHFLKLQNCCSAVGSQLRLSTPNSLIKNCVSRPIQALKAPLNGFSCRDAYLETTHACTHTHSHTCCIEFNTHHENDRTAESFLSFLKALPTHTKISVSVHLVSDCHLHTVVRKMLPWKVNS